MREDLLFQILPYSRSHAVSEKSAILTDTCDFKENQHFSVRMVAELERKNAEFVTRKSTFTDVEGFRMPCRASSYDLQKKVTIVKSDIKNGQKVMYEGLWLVRLYYF